MLQITPVKAGQNAARFDYYAQEYAGIWGGHGSEVLGLSGEVTQREFDALKNNRVPGKSEQLTVRMKKNRRAVYDFCFDLPKSLSIYMADSGDKKMRRLVQEAVSETMYDIEKSLQMRRQKGRNGSVTLYSGNMIYATFIHTTARPVNGVVDPQYHVHVVGINATYDGEEKRWKSGEFGAIKKNAPKFQSEYHERVITKLKANGYRIRRTKDAFELSSISRELIEKFSKRTRLAKEVMNEKKDKIMKRAGWMLRAAKLAGVTFAQMLGKAKARMVADTRERKPKYKPNGFDLIFDWRAQMSSEDRYSIRQASPVVLATIDQMSVLNANLNGIKQGKTKNYDGGREIS